MNGASILFFSLYYSKFLHSLTRTLNRLIKTQGYKDIYIFCSFILNICIILHIHSTLAIPYDNCYEWGVFCYINLWNSVSFECSPCAWSLLALKICSKSFHQYRFDRHHFIFIFFLTCLFFCLQDSGLCSRALAQPTHRRSERTLSLLTQTQKSAAGLKRTRRHGRTHTLQNVSPTRSSESHHLWLHGSPVRPQHQADKRVEGMRNSGTTRHANNVWAGMFMKFENI